MARKVRFSALESRSARLSVLAGDREARLHARAMLLRSCEEFLRTRRGQLIEAQPIDPSDVLRDQRLHDRIEALRFNLRENDADRHRVESAPYPSADVKQRLREQIEAAALRAVPDVSGLIEHDASVGWPQRELVLPLVALSGKEGAPVVGNAMGDAPDVLGLFCWLHRPALLKALEALIDSEADDAHALSAQDRAAKLAEIARNRLVIERHLSALIWHGQSNGDAVVHQEFVLMIAPQLQALLGLLPTCAEFLLTACTAHKNAVTSCQRGSEALLVTVGFADHTESLLVWPAFKFVDVQNVEQLRLLGNVADEVLLIVWVCEAKNCIAD